MQEVCGKVALGVLLLCYLVSLRIAENAALVDNIYNAVVGVNCNNLTQQFGFVKIVNICQPADVEPVIHFVRHYDAYLLQVGALLERVYRIRYVMRNKIRVFLT